MDSLEDVVWVLGVEAEAWTTTAAAGESRETTTRWSAAAAFQTLFPDLIVYLALVLGNIS